MCDNGYLSWSCTVPPDKNATCYKNIRFSEWLESMRKDVECFFGIMKGRFCILRYGFRFHSITECDKLWLSCCALHNMLLDVDGLARNWEAGEQSDWEIMHANSLTHDKHVNFVTPFAVTRLNRDFEMEANKTQEEDIPDLNDDDSKIFDKFTVNGKRIVSKMPLLLFRKCLVEHFNIRFQRNDITWPRRFKINN